MSDFVSYTSGHYFSANMSICDRTSDVLIVDAFKNDERRLPTCIVAAKFIRSVCTVVDAVAMQHFVDTDTVGHTRELR